MDANISNPLTALAEFTPQQFDALKQTAVFYRLSAKMRYLGLSALALCLCSWIFYFNFFTAIHVVVNALMVGASLWAVFRPSTNASLTVCFALLTCGSWNLFCTFYIGLAVFNVILAGIGVLQLMYAVQAYWIYQHYSVRLFDLPAKALKQQYEALWKSIVKPLISEKEDLLSLEINTNQYWWEGLYKQNQIKPLAVLLLPDQAIVAYKARKWLEFIPKNDMVIELGAGYEISVSAVGASAQKVKSYGAKMLNKLGILLRLSNGVFSGYIQTNHFQKYINWKQINDPVMMMSDTFADERQVQARIRKGTTIAIVCYLVFAVVMIVFAMQNLPLS